MTNPDREELLGYADSLNQQADWVEEALAPETPVLQRIGVEDIDIDELRGASDLLRRLASSDSGVRGEPEPVKRYCIYYDGRGEREHPNGDFVHWSDYQRLAQQVTAPPADAGMREALDIAFCAMKDLRYALHREPSVQGRKWVHLGSSLNYAIRKAELALTAPGATTKSDGGAKAGSSPILASKEDQRSDTHGMMPVGDNAANVGSTGVGPSDPSSTRSDVTARELADFIGTLDPDSDADAALLLLDQFQIRRK